MGKINCCICKEQIVKYEMDVGNTVYLASASGFICDDCAKEIANQLIERSDSR